MKVLIVSQYFFPDITAAAFRAHDLYNFLKENGIEVDVLTTYPHKSNVEDVPCDRVFKTHIFPLKNKGVFFYLLHYLSFMIKAIFLSFKLSRRYDYVFTISPPLFVGLAGYIIAKIKRAYVILDIGDLWPDSAVAAGKFTAESSFYKIGRQMEIFLYTHADLITCVAKPMRSAIQKMIQKREDIKKVGGIFTQVTPPEKVHVIYSGPTKAEVDRAIALSTLYSIDRTFEKNTRNIYYAGNIGSVQNLDILIQAAEKLSKRGTEGVAFKLIGEGVERQRLENYVSKKELKNVAFLGLKSREETSRILHEDADILYLSLTSDPTLEKTIPSKLFDYLLLNRPILFGIEGEGKEILENTGACVYFKPGNADALSEATQRLLDNYEHYLTCAKTLRNVVADQFTRETTFKVLLDKIFVAPHRQVFSKPKL